MDGCRRTRDVGGDDVKERESRGGELRRIYGEGGIRGNNRSLLSIFSSAILSRGKWSRVESCRGKQARKPGRKRGHHREPRDNPICDMDSKNITFAALMLMST